MADTPPQELIGRTFEVLTPGEKFDAFQILNCLAMDMLGSFYQVRKARSKDQYSLFLLPPLVRSTVRFRERFRSCSERLIELQHPNLLRYTEQLEVRNRFAYQCEAFAGSHLVKRMEAHHLEQQLLEGKESQEPLLLADHTGGLPENEVREVLLKVLDGLGYLHQQRVLHLNLNPTNIFLREDGEVKILGYGLMEMIGQQLFEQLVSAGVPPLTVGPRQIRLNTVDILSPEKRLGQECDHRADIYAVGMTAYWLLTGRKPTRDYKPPSHLAPGIKAGWDGFVANCLERDPAQRYQSCNQAHGDLANLSNQALSSGRKQPKDPGPAVKSVFRHIEFIPVPRQLRSRGIWTIRAYRLCVIGVFAVALGFGITRVFELAFVDELEQRGMVAIRTPAGAQPRLTLHISPLDVQVSLPSEELSFLVRDGMLQLNILPGTYRMRFDSPRYHSETELITIQREPVVREVTLKPAWAPAEFNGLPGTHVFRVLAGGDELEALGVIDDSGMLRVEEGLFSGEQDFVFTLADHRQRQVRARIAIGQINTIDASVDPLPGALRVRSHPTGAKVYQNGRLLGVTNLTLDDLPVREPFDIIVEKVGYRKEGRRVTLEPNTRTILDIGELNPRAGSLQPSIQLAGRPPTEEDWQRLEIALEVESVHGDESRLYSGSALRELEPLVLHDIPEARVTVSVRHPDYQTLTEAFDITDASTFALVLDLEPRPAHLEVSPVYNADLPDATTLSVNGDTVDWKPGDSIALEPGRAQSIRLIASGYFPAETSLMPGPNEKTQWQPSMQAIPVPEPGLPYHIPFSEIELNWVPPGSFLMGSPARESGRLPMDGPTTQVEITRGFWIGSTELTQAQYEALMGDNPSGFEGSNRPVDSVTWGEAMAFCRELTEREQTAGRLPDGYVYRLPTEAEWEYAARAGRAAPFAWGDRASPSKGNFSGYYPRDFRPDQKDAVETHYGTVEVGQYAPNDWGLYDVHGNVREWCLDAYSARLPGGSQRDWLAADSNSNRRVFRGGGWQDPANRSRLGARGEGLAADMRVDTMGFRIVLAPVATP